jgi:2-amino-4-hydroxy-6-hydroxymethyldihydropteridine diphosphokinase
VVVAESSSGDGSGAGQIAYVALGSNQGDRDALLAFATSALDATPDLAVVAVSRVFETDAVGPPPQSDYLNAALELHSALSPQALLARLLAIERTAGRRRDGDGAPEPARWGPRPLDLDLLLYGDLCIDQPSLTLPHPRLHQRAFVLEPLCDLAGELVHPRLGETLESLARRVRDPKAVRPWPRPIAFEPVPG